MFSLSLLLPYFHHKKKGITKELDVPAYRKIGIAYKDKKGFLLL